MSGTIQRQHTCPCIYYICPMWCIHTIADYMFVCVCVCVFTVILASMHFITIYTAPTNTHVHINTHVHKCSEFSQYDQHGKPVCVFSHMEQCIPNVNGFRTSRYFRTSLMLAVEGIAPSRLKHIYHIHAMHCTKTLTGHNIACAEMQPAFMI